TDMKEDIGTSDFLHWSSRIELMAELSDFRELKRKGGHVVIKTLNEKVGPKLFGTSWKYKLDEDVLKDV
nr:hypothetical protein [Tanacetum cinerariifolium]